MLRPLIKLSFIILTFNSINEFMTYVALIRSEFRNFWIFTTSDHIIGIQLKYVDCNHGGTTTNNGYILLTNLIIFIILPGDRGSSAVTCLS